MTLLSPGQIQTFSGPNNNILYYPGAPYLDGSGVGFSVSGGADEQAEYVGDGVGPYLIGANINGGANVIGYSENLSITQTPAPIPGAGLLSYLVLGLGGLFINRKRLWQAARMAAYKFG